MANPSSESGTVLPPVFPELFIGLVAAVGTDHDQLSALLVEALKSFGYSTHTIRLTKLLRAIPRFKNLKTSPVDEYIASHQNAGDQFRALIENKNALAALGMSGIRGFRSEKGDKDRIVDVRLTLFVLLRLPRKFSSCETSTGMHSF